MNIAFKLMIQELVDECLKGNRNAQRRLYEYFYGKMMGICLRYANNRDDAADILNQGFLKVFNNLHKFKSEEGVLEAWIRRIIINTAIDHYRKEIRRQSTTNLDYAYKESVSAPIISSIAAEEIMELIQNLSPAYRTVFNLYVLEGYNHREIGELLGISEGTSKSNLAKARARLQKEIRELNKVNFNRYVK